MTRVVPDQALVDAITTACALLRHTAWTDLGGSWTTNVRLGDRVARIHPTETTLDRVLAEQAARVVLAEAAIPTVMPASVVVVDGHVVEVEPYVRWTRRMSTPELLERGFEILARVHDVLAGASLPPAAQTVRWANHISSEAAVAATRCGADRLRGSGDPSLRDFADRAVAHVDTVASAEAELAAGQVVQLVHGDFWDNNVLFDDHRQLVALIDFGFMGRRPRVDDLALTVWFWLLQPGSGLPGDDAIATVARWLDAYDAHTDRPLSAIERAALPLAVARQPAWSVGGWVLALDQANAYRHAREAAAEQPVAEAVLAQLAQWQAALTR